MLHARVHLAHVTTGSLGKAEAGDEGASAIAGSSPTGDTTRAPKTPRGQFALFRNGGWAKARFAAGEEWTGRTAHVGRHHDFASRVTVARTHFGITVAVCSPFANLAVEGTTNLGVTWLLFVQERRGSSGCFSTGASSKQLLGSSPDASTTGGRTFTP